MADPTAPVILFTDIVSGPNSGGVGGNGAFVTLYGLRFSASKSSADTVTIGGVEVAAYTAWNPSDPNAIDPNQRMRARNLQTITVQPGAAIVGDSLDVVVTSGGKRSNAVSFSAKASGKIWFVDSGYVGGANDGSATHPFTQLAAVKKVAGVIGGDVVYLKGSFLPPDPEQSTSAFVLSDTTRPNTAAGAPVAYIGYPGAPATIGGVDSGHAAATGMTLSSSATASHLVFANLVFVNASTGIQTDAIADVRIVGIHFQAVDVAVVSSSAAHLQVLGNYFRALTGGSLSPGPLTTSDVAWNETYNLNGVGGGMDLSSSSADVRFFGNLFSQVHYLDLVTGKAAVFNNVFAFNENAAVDLTAASSATPILIANNTFFEVIAGLREDQTPAAGTYIYRNNALWSASGGYVSYAPASPGTPPTSAFGFSAADHDFYEANGVGATSVVSSVEIDAHVITDFALTSAAFDTPSDLDVTPFTGSALIDAGADTGLCGDYYGVKRPQGAAYDVGAAEAP